MEGCCLLKIAQIYIYLLIFLLDDHLPATLFLDYFHHSPKVADFGFSRDVMVNNIYERKSEGRLPIRWMAPESLYDNIYTT